MLGLTPQSSQKEIDEAMDQLEFEFENLGEDSEFQFVAYCVTEGMEDWFYMASTAEDALYGVIKEIEMAIYQELGMDDIIDICVS